MSRIKLKNGNEFDCEQVETILNAALRQNKTLEHSCRTGRCGVCKTKVLTGKTMLLRSELSLSEQEVNAGYILTCCRSAETNVTLDLCDLQQIGNYKPKTLPARINSVKLISDDVVEVILRTPPSSKIEYCSGQYIDVIGNGGIRRSYSIANAPDEQGIISLQIRRVEKGKMSSYWFEKAKENDLLRIEGPFGTFFLRKTGAKRLILIATGTGIAPIKAILEELSKTPEKNSYETIYLYWGGRTEKDIYWHPEFKSLRIEFIPVLSRQQKKLVRSGYVQQAVHDDFDEFKSSVVYACGSESMIRSAHELLISAGLDSGNFYSDAFVSSN